VKIFVGNLEYSATEQDVIAFFAEHHICVQGVKIPTQKETGAARGYCFVEISDVDEQRAIDLQGKDILGRTVRIAPARAQKLNVRNCSSN